MLPAPAPAPAVVGSPRFYAVSHLPQPLCATPLHSFYAAWLSDDEADPSDEVLKALTTIAGELHQHWTDEVPYLDQFWAELARCIGPELAPSELVPALAKIHACDLHLAFACRHGHGAALARFERNFVAPLVPIIARVDSSPTFVDEIQQRLRTKLLVAEPGALSKLAYYRGQGPLATWLRVVVIREALGARRRPAPLVDPEDEQILAVASSTTGPELATIAAQHRTHLSAAFAQAFAELDPGQRNLLRCHYLHGLSIDELASVHHVHRSTVARRIIKAREQLLTGTREQLAQRLALSETELQQMFAAVASRLDLSIERLLGA